eukprot:22572-Alexandrium_andersonii.AAC.1
MRATTNWGSCCNVTQQTTTMLLRDSAHGLLGHAVYQHRSGCAYASRGARTKRRRPRQAGTVREAGAARWGNLEDERVRVAS